MATEQSRPVRKATQPVEGIGIAAVAALAIGTAIAAAAFTRAAAPELLADPGALVRWGLIAVGPVVVLAQTLTVGLLVLAATILPTPGPGRADIPALRAASVAAAVWAIAGLVQMVLQYAAIAGESLTAPGFGSQLRFFAGHISLGQQEAVGVAVACLVSLIAAGAGTPRAAGLLTLLALAGLVPAALSGHAAGSSDHETAVTALGLHLVGACVWVGGLTGLMLMRGHLAPGGLAVAAGRFSRLAAWCFGAVVLSGVISAALRLGGPADLASRYGLIVVAKVVALLVLGWLGLRQRRVALPGLAAGRPWAFTRLAGVEVAVMAVAIGLGAALSRSAPPVSQGPPAGVTLAQSVTGYPLPPAPTPLRWLTVWQPDLLWLLLAGLGAVLYAVGVSRLRARGDSWPLGRTISWAAGVVVLVYVTGGPPSAYGRVLFSAHMLGHMTMSMVVPLLLVLGAPVTLALRTLPARQDASRGPREWLVAVLESGFMRVLSSAPVAGALFAGSLVVFYYSPAFHLALTTHVGHELMQVHFLVVGYLFTSVLVGVDPGPRRPPYPLRLLLLFAVMAFHAFFGVALYSGSSVLQARYFGGLGRTWGGSLLADQRLGGGLAWAIGELPTLILAVIMAVQWARAEDREARRWDRAADRSGDAELAAYNEMLARLAARDTAREAAADAARKPAGDAARAAPDGPQVPSRDSNE